MSFDLKTALVSIAPTLAAMLGGPMAGTAVAALASCFGLPSGAGVDDVSKVMQGGGLTPEIMASVRAADQKHAEVLGQQGIDLADLNNKHAQAMAQAEVEDRKDARKNNGTRTEVWWIAMGVLTTFAVIMTLVLVGCWQLLSGGMPVKDVAVVAAVSGLVGAVVGYVAANAQTVINFIFGGSLGNQKHADELAASVKQALQLPPVR